MTSASSLVFHVSSHNLAISIDGWEFINDFGEPTLEITSDDWDQLASIAATGGQCAQIKIVSGNSQLLEITKAKNGT